MSDTLLNADIALRRAFDPDTDSLRVDATVTATIGSVDVVIDASSDNIAISDGTHTLDINPDGSINVVVGSGSGLATSAKQDTGNASLAAINGKIPALGQATMANSSPVVIASNQSAVPISAASLPLPSGAATETTLSTVNTKIPSNLTVTSNRLLVDGSGVTQPVSGTFWQATQPVSGPLTDTQLRASPVPISGTVTANTGLSVAQGSTTSGQNGLLTMGAVTTNAPSYTTGQTAPVSLTLGGAQRVQVDNSPSVFAPSITKGVQGVTGFTVQDLKDAGRNITNYFHALPIVATNTEVLATLTGYKSGAAVVATSTPAVVTTGKIYRITSITISYTQLSSVTNALIRLRANTSGVVALASPLVATWAMGTSGNGTATAGYTSTQVINFPDGLEFAAGTGIGISVQGYSSAWAVLAAGYVSVNIQGYEY